MSERVDEYFAALEVGMEGKKPKRRMTKWFSDILRFLEARRGLGWTELEHFLLTRAHSHS
jgi:hypothetical protein